MGPGVGQVGEHTFAEVVGNYVELLGLDAQILRELGRVGGCRPELLSLRQGLSVFIITLGAVVVCFGTLTGCCCSVSSPSIKEKSNSDTLFP